MAYQLKVWSTVMMHHIKVQRSGLSAEGVVNCNDAAYKGTEAYIYGIYFQTSGVTCFFSYPAYIHAKLFVTILGRKYCI